MSLDESVDMNAGYRHKRFPAFTLMELLVVIAVIASLIAILIPCLSKARSMARRLACTSNLRQINLAVNLYAVDNADNYPCAEDPLPQGCWLWMGRGWRGFIEPYLKGKSGRGRESVLWCPADYTDPNRYESTSYAYSMAFYHRPHQIDSMTSFTDTLPPTDPLPSVPQKTLSVKNPSRKILIGEWYSNHHPIEPDKGWFGWTGRRNYLFADGAVQFLHADRIAAANDGLPNPNLTVKGINGIDYPVANTTPNPP